MTQAPKKKRGHKLEPLARKLYVEGGMLQKEIAEYIGVSEVTIGKWKTKNRWDIEKNRLVVSPTSLINNLYKQIQNIVEAQGDLPMDARTVNNIKMISSTIRELDKKIDTVVVIDVFKGFIKWLQTIDLAAAKSIVDYQREYVQILANED